MTIPEIYPGIERAAVVVGADVYQLYGVTDAIAHEYEFGGGNHMASGADATRLVPVSGRHAHLPRVRARARRPGSSITRGMATKHRAARSR